MKIYYVIKDILTKEYYWSYRADDGFSIEISSAYKFSTKDEAIEQMGSEYLNDLFSGRIVEIVEIYSFE